MIPLLIGLFLVILFIVFLVLSASTWRGWHIAAAALIFLATLGLVVVGSLSHKTHTKWKKEYAELKNRLEEQKELGTKLEIGDPKLVEPETPSVHEVRQRLSRMLLDRGRVWRRSSMLNALQGNNRIVVSTVPLNKEGEPAGNGAAESSGIDTNMVLYVFRESQVQLPNGQEAFVPVKYLGEFRVASADQGQVTLEPTMPLDGEQRRLLQDASASLALYEMMPLDAHRVFAETDTLGRALDNTQDQPVFGRMDEQRLRTIFATVTGLAPDDPYITSLVQPYLKDGYAASERDVNVSPSNIWMKLEFEEPHQVQVDSDNVDPGVGGTFFDPEGYANVSRLRAGEEASFRVNDIGVFPYAQEEDRQWVDQLAASGVAQKIGPVFVRSLEDYEGALHDIQQRFIKRNQDIQRAKRDIANLQESIRQTQEQIAYRQQEREQLKEDREGFARDNQKMDELLTALKSQKSALQQELSDLYQTNLALNQQLEAYHARLSEELERRADSVAIQ